MKSRYVNIWERKMIKAALKMFVGAAIALTILFYDNSLPQSAYRFLNPTFCVVSMFGMILFAEGKKQYDYAKEIYIEKKREEICMNKVILMGRLTRDPDVRYSQAAEPLAIARYTLAVDRRFQRRDNSGNEQTADFISCVAFGKNGEFAEKYLKQGTKIAITGRIQTGSYTNKDGNKVYTTEVVVEEQEFAESKKSQGYPEPGNASADGFTDIPTGLTGNDLPFK